LMEPPRCQYGERGDRAGGLVARGLEQALLSGRSGVLGPGEAGR
jgi:hypothetical protein